MTIKDIARESGFAIGTVSRALNNAPRRQRRDAAEDPGSREPPQL